MGALVCLTAASTLAALLLACGPFLTDLLTVQTRQPAHPEEYGRGNVGVVRPVFARKYLVQAYRRFSNRPPLPNIAPPASTAPLDSVPVPPATEWVRLAGSVLGPQAPSAPVGQQRIDWPRSIGNYQSIDNCLEDAFASAITTLQARIARFGQASPAVQDWTRAQTAVFANCSGKELVLPEPAPASTDAVIRADRAYQTAAAYFYATRYAEAEQRFRAIAADDSSSWRKYGRYLAARALIRRATVAIDDKAPPADELLTVAEQDLNAVLADATAASLHNSARGLLEFVAVRLRPVSRLQALSRTLATSETVSDQALIDFQYLMNRFGGDTSDGTAVAGPAPEPIRDDDMVEWIVAIQGQSDASLAHALEQWKKTHATLWLIALLWRMPPAHADAPAVLADAATMKRGTPAFDTIAFLRVRLLIAQGKRDDARGVLAALPAKAASDVLPETINLLKAERFMVARTLDELLTNAPRAIVNKGVDQDYYGRRSKARSAKDALGAPAFDEDSAIVFTQRLPVDRLVAAARSSVLPDRLRVRVAIAAFTRAVLLGRDDAAMAVAPRLRSLSPQLAADLDRYTAVASPIDRHRAAILLLLRAPGMHVYVRGTDDDVSYQVGEPARQFDHVFRRNWWCGVDKTGREQFTAPESDSGLLALLYGGPSVPFPEFLTAAERATVERELTQLAALGPGPDYLALEAVKWARAAPKDVNAAEALAHAVEGGRWSCEGKRDPELSRRAFQTLHRLFPDSRWAAQTKYWYQ
jgi:hypothetical protein